jgi:hypothetical protein
VRLIWLSNRRFKTGEYHFLDSGVLMGYVLACRHALEFVRWHTQGTQDLVVIGRDDNERHKVDRAADQGSKCPAESGLGSLPSYW